MDFLSMALNDEEKKKLFEGFSKGIAQAIINAFDSPVVQKHIETALERVLIKYKIISAVIEEH